MGEGTGVLVIGGGPAGLAAAIAARMKGFDVTVADGAKPPIDKACGEGLMPGTLRALRELGVAIRPGDGQVFRGIRFVDSANSVEASFSGASGFGMRRIMLHQKMAERAEECGVTLLWNTPVTGLSSEGAILGEKIMKAKWIVGADGIHSRVRRWIGLDSSARLEKRFAQRRHFRVKPWTDCMEVHWGNRAQAYVTPLGNDETCVALISRDPRMRLTDAWPEFPVLASYMRHAEPSSAERGAVAVSRSGPSLADAGSISSLEKACGEDFGRRSRTICSTVGRSCGRNFYQFSGSHEYAPWLAISDGVNEASRKNALVSNPSG